MNFNLLFVNYLHFVVACQDWPQFFVTFGTSRYLGLTQAHARLPTDASLVNRMTQPKWAAQAVSTYS